MRFVCNQGRNYGKFGQFLRLKMDKIDAVNSLEHNSGSKCRVREVPHLYYIISA